jgi:hypothetical protein
MVQIVAKEFLCLIEIGATRPFIIQDEEGMKWVVKALGNPFGTQAVFNEHVAGGLARLIDLPWPRTSLISLSPAVIKALAGNNFKAASSMAVGGEYINGLSPVNLPCHSVDPNGPTPTMLEAFYGKCVFDNWILMKDTKSDTLHMLPDGRPIFLDATFAFGFIHEEEGWDTGRLSWNEADFNLESSPYMIGVLVDRARYNVWIERIKGVTKEQIEVLLASVPKDWKVPPAYMQALEQFLDSSRTVFVPLFQEYLEYLNFI